MYLHKTLYIQRDIYAGLNLNKLLGSIIIMCRTLL